MQISRPRKPRFQRDGSARIELTARDLQILEEAARHRFIQSHHLVMLLGGSAQHLVRRLRKLYHAGLLERPQAQTWLRSHIASSMVYCLTQEGRKLLLGRGIECLPPVPRSTALSMALFLGHALRLTDVLVALRVAALKQRAAFAWVHGPVLEDLPSRWLAWRCQWLVTTTGQRRSLVIPDAVFSLTATDGTVKYFVLEVDRGTMPVSRRNTQQSSFQRKLELYKETRRQGLLWKTFGISAFRVLVVTESRKRMISIQKATAAMFSRGDSDMFLFATAEEILGQGRTNNWETCGGKNMHPLP